MGSNGCHAHVTSEQQRVRKSMLAAGVRQFGSLDIVFVVKHDGCIHGEISRAEYEKAIKAKLMVRRRDGKRLRGWDEL
jgi:hypothetical protein